MDLGLAPHPLGFGATSAWGRRCVRLGSARLGRGPARPWTPSADRDILSRQRARLGGAMNEAIARPAVAGHNRPRNPGAPLAPDWFESVGVNASAVERRAATLTTRRSVKKEYQAAWLVKAMTCIDLTTLAGDDTPERVRRLCAKARRPLSEELIAALGLADAQSDGRGGLRLSDHGRPSGEGARGFGNSRRLRRDRLSRRAHAAEAAARRDPLCGQRGRARDRHRHHPRSCASAATGARSTTRSRRCAKPAGRRI